MSSESPRHERLEVPVVPSSSSSGPSTRDNDHDNEKEKEWDEDLAGSEASIKTIPDDEAYDENQLPRKHRIRQVGMLKLRAADDDFPTDWWFASTAIPLIAATFAPMANLMSISALVVPWRNNVVEDTPLTYQSTSVGYPDPHWCTSLNIASLVCGFVGNLFLLFNFTKRVRYIVALPTTIVMFYVSSSILIAITSCMNVYVPPGNNQVYSQGFWNAVIAACLYLFNSMILMVNMLGYFLGHYPQHFTLSDEQRNLILQTMMFFIWLGGGAGVYSQIEGWDYPDAVYFCDVTILTVGFGDYYPTDDLARGLIMPYSMGGIITLGLMVSSIHKFAGELSTLNVLRKHVENRRANTLSRVVTVDKGEEERRDELEREVEMDRRQGRVPTISAPLPDPRIQQRLDEEAASLSPRASLSPQRDPHTDRQLEFGTTDASELKKAHPPEHEPHPHQFLAAPHRRKGLHATLKLITNPVTTLRRVRTQSQKVLLMREEKDRFNAMRDIQVNAQKFKKWWALTMSLFAFGVLWCVGAVVFWKAEHDTQDLSYFEALYFCYVSLLTIGYGDLSPKSNAGKAFFVVWSLIAVPTMTILVSDMGDTVISSFKRGTFILGDMTVLPKAGLWHGLLKSNPWLWNWATRKVEKKRRTFGMEVGPAADQGLPSLTIEQLADQELTEAELTQRLAWAIRKTADDLAHAPGKRYSYEEWCEFTRLIRFTKEGLTQLEYDEDTDGVVEWDWLEENSPMLSVQSESEWIIDRLCESLLRLLKKALIVRGRDPESALSHAVPDILALSTPVQGPGGEKSPTDTKPHHHHHHHHHKGKSHEHLSPPDTPQPRQRRGSIGAAGADAVLTFFTGERSGEHAYAEESPQWSKKAKERNKKSRRMSAAQLGRRRGPFGSFEYQGPTGALGGGRGGAGSRILKMRNLDGNGTR